MENAGRRLSLKNIAETCAGTFTVTYEGDGSHEDIYVRTRTQAELEASDLLAAKEKVRIGEAYAPGQPKYEALKQDVSLMDDLALASQIVQIEEYELRQSALRGTTQIMPFDPEAYRTDKEREDAKRKWDQRAKQYELDCENTYNKAVEERTQTLLALGHDALVEQALRPMIADRIGGELQPYLWNWAILDCFRDSEDHSKPYFDSVDEIPQIVQVKAQMLTVLTQVNQVQACDIKNSQGRSVRTVGSARSTLEPGTDLSTEDSSASE